MTIVNDSQLRSLSDSKAAQRQYRQAGEETY